MDVGEDVARDVRLPGRLSVVRVRLTKTWNFAASRVPVAFAFFLMVFDPRTTKRAARHRVAALRFLARAAARGEAPQGDELLDLVLSAGRRDRGALFRVDDEGLELDVVVRMPEALRRATSELPFTDPAWFIADKAARCGVSIAGDSVLDRGSGRAYAEIDRQGWEKAVAVPIVTRDRIAGVLVVAGPEPKPDDEFLMFMEAACDLFGMAKSAREEGRASSPSLLLRDEQIPGRSSSVPSVPADAPRSIRATAATVPATRAARAARSVVWIDGDFELLERVHKSMRGLELRTASSASEAEIILSERTPSIVFCELSLPDGAGIELYERATAVRPELKGRFVFTSSGLASPQLLSCVARVSVPTLTKPVDLEMVATLVLEAPADVTPEVLFGSARRHKPASEPSMREKQLALLASSVATILRATGPMRSQDVLARLRERGLDHAEALAVITFGLTSGALERSKTREGVISAGPPPSSRVLVVDDDLDVLESVSSVLADAGYAVDTATSGFEALSKIRATPPRVLVLDLMMPEISGFRVLEVLDRDPELASIPVVVVSAAKRTLVKDRDTSRGFTFLPKPVDLETLVGAVRRYHTEASPSP